MQVFVRSILLLCIHAIYAQQSTSSSSSSAFDATLPSTITSAPPTSTTSASSIPLGAGESIVTEPVYVSSLKAFITTTYTTTTTPVAVSKPTDLPSSLVCDSSYTNGTGAFCIPNNGTEQIKGKQYSVTWNYDYAPNCTDVYVAMLYYGNENGQLVASTQQPNILGFWNYTVESSWLNGQSSQYAQFELIPYNCGEGTVDKSTGPVVELLSKRPVTKEKATSKDEILGLSIGLPIALIAFVGTAIFVMWWNKSHRQIPIFAKRRKGYTGRSQRAVRLQNLGSRSGEETYRDDPIQA